MHQTTLKNLDTPSVLTKLKVGVYFRNAEKPYILLKYRVM